MSAVAQLLPDLPVRRALAAMGGAHATWYRNQQPRKPRRARRCVPPLALSAPERETIIETLNSARYADCTPYTVWARLLAEGVYLASIRTFFRVLAGERAPGPAGAEEVFRLSKLRELWTYNWVHNCINVLSSSIFSSTNLSSPGWSVCVLWHLMKLQIGVYWALRSIPASGIEAFLPAAVINCASADDAWDWYARSTRLTAYGVGVFM